MPADAARYRWLVWTLAGTAAVLLVVGEVIVLARMVDGHPPVDPVWAFGLEYLASWLVVGLVLALRVPGNPLGLLFLTLAVLGGVQEFGWALAQALGSQPSTGVDIAAAISGIGQVGGVAGWLMVVPHLLPTGRPVSPRWAVWFRASVVGVVLTALGEAATDSGVRQIVGYARSPLPLPPGIGSAVVITGNVLLLLGAVSGVASLVVRWRRGTVEVRLQLKWLVCAGLLVVALYAAQGPVGLNRLPDWVGVSLWLVVGGALPAGIAAAILRYRLYDIDRLLSRTLAYALVTGLLVGVYIGVVTATTRLLPLSSSFGVAASTLAVAALFHPVRRRVQQRVDRRFNRARYDAVRAVEAFTVRLRDQTSTEAVAADLASVVATTLQPRVVVVWLRPAG